MDNFTISVNKYWRDFGKIASGKKIIIAIVLVGSFLFGISAPIFMANVGQPAKVVPSPTPVPIPASVDLSTKLNTVTSGNTFTATINVNSPNQGVEAADFVVNFDPNYLKVATISSGNYFGIYPVKTTEDSVVRISGMANLVKNKFIIPIGRGTVAAIQFETLSATNSTKITFDREKTIVASKGQNILDSNKITDLEVSIK